MSQIFFSVFNYEICDFDPPLSIWKRLWYWLINKTVMHITISINNKPALTFLISYRHKKGREIFNPPIVIQSSDNFAATSNTKIPCSIHMYYFGGQ